MKRNPIAKALKLANLRKQVVPNKKKSPRHALKRQFTCDTDALY